MSHIRVISSEHRTCTLSDRSVRVMPGGEACAGFVTVTVESEGLWGGTRYVYFWDDRVARRCGMPSSRRNRCVPAGRSSAARLEQLLGYRGSLVYGNAFQPLTPSPRLRTRALLTDRFRVRRPYSWPPPVTRGSSSVMGGGHHSRPREGFIARVDDPMPGYCRSGSRLIDMVV